MEKYIADKLANTASETTLKKRIQWLILLSKKFENAKDFSFLNDYEKVLESVTSTDNIDSQWNRLWHIKSAINSDPALINDEAIKAYQDYINDKKEIRMRKADQNYKTEKQKIALKETLTFRQEQINEQIDNLYQIYGLDKSKNLTKTVLTKLGPQVFEFAKIYQKLLSLAMYILQPAIRNDYNDINIISAKNQATNDKNYIHIRPTKSVLILNNYKTANAYGKQEIEIQSDKLIKLINHWVQLLTFLLKQKPTKLFYYKITKTNIQSENGLDAIRKALGRNSELYLGQKLTINDFRHLWEIDIQTNPKYSKYTVEQKKQIHMRLLHSMDIAQKYNVIDN